MPTALAHRRRRLRLRRPARRPEASCGGGSSFVVAIKLAFVFAFAARGGGALGFSTSLLSSSLSSSSSLAAAMASKATSYRGLFQSSSFSSCRHPLRMSRSDQPEKDDGADGGVESNVGDDDDNDYNDDDSTRTGVALSGDGREIGGRATAATRKASVPTSQGTSNGGNNIATTIGLLGILAVFVVSSAAPLLDVAFDGGNGGGSGGGGTAVSEGGGGGGGGGGGSVRSELTNVAVTRQDPDSLRQRRNEGSRYDRLSVSRIQDKLGGLPVFYLVKVGGGSAGGGNGGAAAATAADNGEGKIVGRKFYMSYDDAKVAAMGEEALLVETAEGDNGGGIGGGNNAAVSALYSSSKVVVKATTLDQVMYPLILNPRSGNSSSSSTTKAATTTTTVAARAPVEVEKAIASLSSSAAEATLADGPSSVEKRTFKLISSKAARDDAASMEMDVADRDVPLFLADRLAFAGRSGPQVPLFLEKADAVTSYDRLREAGGNKLPAVASIRSTTLLEEIYSMERGTRPGVSQLAFYAPERDLIKADELMESNSY